MKFKLWIGAALAGALLSNAAVAQITIGISIAATGPQASLGVHYKNAFELMPKTIAGEAVKFIILDNASDATNAARNGRKLVTEDRVDVLMGSNGVPATMALAQVANESKTPLVTLSPATLSPENFNWVFIVPQPTELMMDAVARDVKKRNLKTLGYIGFSDGWGDLV